MGCLTAWCVGRKCVWFAWLRQLFKNKALLVGKACQRIQVALVTPDESYTTILFVAVQMLCLTSLQMLCLTPLHWSVESSCGQTKTVWT